MSINDRNSTVFLLVIGIPVFAVVASMSLIFEAVRSKDPELPIEYGVEGRALDADYAAAERAQSAGVALTIDYVATNRLRVRAAANDESMLPQVLNLRFTHTTQPVRDRHVTLQRSEGNLYVAAFAPLERGRWLLQVDGQPGDGAAWMLRKRLHAPFDVVTIDRRHP